MVAFHPDWDPTRPAAPVAEEAHQAPAHIPLQLTLPTGASLGDTVSVWITVPLAQAAPCQQAFAEQRSITFWADDPQTQGRHFYQGFLVEVVVLMHLAGGPCCRFRFTGRRVVPGPG